MSRPCSICREIVLDRTQEAPIAINHHHHHHLVHHHHHHFECMENKGTQGFQRTKVKSRRAKARGHHFNRKENKRWAKSTTLNPGCSWICCTTGSLPFLSFCPSSGLEVVRRTRGPTFWSLASFNPAPTTSFWQQPLVSLNPATAPRWTLYAAETKMHHTFLGQ